MKHAHEFILRRGVLGGVFFGAAPLAAVFAQETSGQPLAADYYAQIAEANQNMVSSVSTITTGGGSGFSSAQLFAGILFGAIGLGAFIYGKKNSMWRPMGLGLALMAFPYFPLGTMAQYLVGAALTAALFLWRE